MASTKLFMVLVIGAIIVPSISAVEYVVGDDHGWTINYDYQKWASNKVFYVGDKLGTYSFVQFVALTHWIINFLFFFFFFSIAQTLWK